MLKNVLLSGFFGLAVLASACSGTGPAAGPVRVLQPEQSQVVPIERPPACDDQANLAVVSREESPLQMLRVAAELAAESDMACGFPEDLERQCRALFFLSATEPTLVWADAGDWEASLEVWQFAIEDGLASSSPDLALMWARLAAYVDGLEIDLASSDEPAIAARVVDRGEVAPDLSVLENTCAAAAG